MCIPTHLFALCSRVLCFQRFPRVITAVAATWFPRSQTVLAASNSNHVCRTAPHRARIALISARTNPDEHRPRHAEARVPRSCIRHVLHVDAGRQEPVAGALPSRRKVALDQGARGGASGGRGRHARPQPERRPDRAAEGCALGAILEREHGEDSLVVKKGYTAVERRCTGLTTFPLAQWLGRAACGGSRSSRGDTQVWSSRTWYVPLHDRYLPFSPIKIHPKRGNLYVLSHTSLSCTDPKIYIV
jgi:hypothetical protein